MGQSQGQGHSSHPPYAEKGGHVFDAGRYTEKNTISGHYPRLRQRYGHGIGTLAKGFTAVATVNIAETIRDDSW